MLLAATLAGLFGCGGGGDSPTGTPPPPAATPASVQAWQAAAPQEAAVGNSVPLRPAVVVRNAARQPVAGVTVTFAVTAGGGTLDGPVQTTGTDGVATLGAWRLGPAVGANMVEARLSGASVDGNPVVFQATGIRARASAVVIAHPGPVLLGDALTLGAAARDAEGRTTDAPLVWTSRSPAVLDVEAASGRLTARSVGEAVVVVQADDARDSLRIAVAPGGGLRHGPAAALDSTMLALLAERQLVGGAIAVMVDGRLVYARGYGWADRDARRVVDPSTIFRLYSISKTITAMAVLRAIEDGRLRLTDSAYVVRSDLTTLQGMTEDPRTRAIRIEHLLWFTSGLLYRYPDPALDCWRGGSLGAEGHVRCARGLPLAFDPGTQQAYTNEGALILARVLERVTGMPYADHVRRTVLEPAGAPGIAMMRWRLADRPPTETRYYPSDWTATFGTRTSTEQYDATGGWTGSPASLLRYLRGVTGGGATPSILSPTSRALLTQRPASGVPASAHTWLGPLFYPTPEGAGHRFEGQGVGSDGGCAFYSHAPNGVSYAFAVNTSPAECWSLDAIVKPRVRGVPVWPSHDLFPTTP